MNIRRLTHDEWSFLAGLFHELSENPINADNYASVVEDTVGSDSVVRALAEYPLHLCDSSAHAATAVGTDWGFAYPHASELRYLFRLTEGGVLTAARQQLSDRMVKYWSAFARTGDPNSSGDTVLAPVRRERSRVSALMPSPVTESGFTADHHCDFWSTQAQAAAGLK